MQQTLVSKIAFCYFPLDVFCLSSDLYFQYFVIISSCWALPSANKCPCGKKTGKQCYSSIYSSAIYLNCTVN